MERAQDRRRARRGASTDDRPPICPACGVTMGIVVDEETGEARHSCLECGFDEHDPD